MNMILFRNGLLSLTLTGLTTLSLVASAGSVDPEQVVRPAGTTAATASQEELLSMGETLWNDKALGSSKLSCASCHKKNVKRFKKTFLEPYPHMVKMAKKKAKLDEVTTEGMVQLCMVVPMKTEPLPWDSLELSALSAYIEEVVQPAYIEAKGEKEEKTKKSGGSPY